MQVLTERGFKFETAPDGRSQSQEHRATSLLSTLRSYEDNKTADQTKSELQSSTFAKLRRHNIAATANRKIKLVLCAGVSDKRPRSGSGSPFPCEPKYILQLGLVRLLTSQPQFVSVTFTANEPASILLEKDHLACFAVPEVLLGAKEDILVPIMLDLTQLPIESTGIVCGVAGRLVRGTVHNRAPPVDMIYLSTTCAGTVIVPENELGGALSALNEEALDAQYTDMF